MNERETTGVSELEREQTMISMNCQEAAPASMPADLREEVGEQILLKLALDSVQCLERSQLSAAVSGDANLRPEMMLTLLSYCYAARIYGSRDVEWATRNDRTVRYIRARTFPDWRAIRHFRRHNRELLEQCLAYVLKKAWILQLQGIDGDWAMGQPAALKGKFLAQAREKIEVAMIVDRAD